MPERVIRIAGTAEGDQLAVAEVELTVEPAAMERRGIVLVDRVGAVPVERAGPSARDIHP